MAHTLHKKFFNEVQFFRRTRNFNHNHPCPNNERASSKRFFVREFAILKLDYNEKNSARINHTVDFYGARMLDFSEDVLMVEVSGSTEKIDSIIQEFGKKIVLESMRTGKTGLKKGKRNT